MGGDGRKWEGEGSRGGEREKEGWGSPPCAFLQDKEDIISHTGGKAIRITAVNAHSLIWKKVVSFDNA